MSVFWSGRVNEVREIEGWGNVRAAGVNGRLGDHPG
jgi:hypothetical protein